jgi:hypothetical protein
VSPVEVYHRAAILACELLEQDPDEIMPGPHPLHPGRAVSFNLPRFMRLAYELRKAHAIQIALERAPPT